MPFLAGLNGGTTGLFRSPEATGADSQGLQALVTARQ